jgi:polysaccharide biosynthesis transport protein
MQDMNEIAPRQDLSPSPLLRTPSYEEEDSTDLRNYWYVVYRHRWPAIIFFLSAFFLTIIAIPWGDSVYTAKTTLYVQSPILTTVTGPEVRTSPSDIATQLRLLSSRSLAAQVIKDLKLEKNENFTKSSQSILSWIISRVSLVFRTIVSWTIKPLITLIQTLVAGPTDGETKPSEFELGVSPGLIDLYLAKLVVTPLPESQLVQVQFTSASPALSKTVVNRHAVLFIEKNLATRFELTAETKEFLEKKLVELKANVEASEKALTQFQRTHEVVALDKGGSLMLDQLKKLNLDLTEARSRRIELESLHQVVQKKDNQILSQIIDNPMIQGLRKQITDLESRRSEMETKFKPTYRGVIALQQEIDAAKGRLNAEISRITQSIEKDYGAARAKESAIAAETEKARQFALDSQEQAVAYAVLDREVTSNRALYEAVYKKTKEAALTGTDPTPVLRVVDRADVPLLPDAGKWQKILVLGIGAGMFGAIGLAFLFHILDNTLRNPEDIARFVRLPTLGVVPDIGKLLNDKADGTGDGKEVFPYLHALENTVNSPEEIVEQFQIPVLGVVPDVGSLTNGKTNGAEYIKKIFSFLDRSQVQRGDKSELTTSDNPISMVGELYRNICTAILFSKAEKSPQTILFTSSQPNEGKTVTAINLSIILAQSGLPVLLIDADLRAGHCNRLLGLKDGAGLTSVLTGHGDAFGLIRKTSVENLSLLSRGASSPNPADLLGSGKMRQILDALAGQFRFIVIDSAPLLPVTDTVLLSRHVDGVILVARGDHVSRNLVRKARERLDSVQARILGVVLNGVDIENPEYGEYREVYRSYYTRYYRRDDDTTGKGFNRDDTVPQV